jgi:hypothetical protein
MTVKLDTTMQKYNEDGGNAKFIKTVTSALKIDQSLMKVTQLRSGSVYVTFTVDTDDSISLKSLKNKLNDLLNNKDIGYPVLSVTQNDGRESPHFPRVSTSKDKSDSKTKGKSSKKDRIPRDSK